MEGRQTQVHLEADARCEAFRKAGMIGVTPPPIHKQMPNTGLFQLNSVEGVRDEDGTLIQVTRIDATCMLCRRWFAATTERNLEDVNGAAILSCPACNNRQAISRDRLQDFQ